MNLVVQVTYREEAPKQNMARTKPLSILSFSIDPGCSCVSGEIKKKDCSHLRSLQPGPGQRPSGPGTEKKERCKQDFGGASGSEQ